MDYTKATPETKPEETKQEVTGAVVKPSEGKKIAKALVGGTLEEVKNHTLYDVIIPGIKKLFLDSISILLFGETRPTSTIPKPKVVSSQTSYTSFWTQPTASVVPKAVASSVDRFDYYDIAVETEDKASWVLEQLDNYIEHKGYCTVAQMYELVGLKAPFTSEYYGWRSVATAKIRKFENTADPSKPYVIKMPRLETVQTR